VQSFIICTFHRLLAYFLYLKKIKIKLGLWNHLAVVCVCVSVYPPPPPAINFRMFEPIFMKLGMYIIALEPISAAYLKNPSHQSVCLHPPIIAKQRLGKHVFAATNARNSRRIVDASSSIRSVSCQRKVCGSASVSPVLVHVLPKRSKTWSWVPWDGEPRITVLARSSSSLLDWTVYPPTLLDNSSINKFPRQRRIVGGVVFSAVRVVSNESRRLVLTRTFCY
jgi:hypothetical protein